MNSNNEDNYSLGDFVKSVKNFWHYLLKKWWVLLLAGFIGGVLGFIYYNNIQKPKYEAVCTFILEEKQSGVGGLSGIASQFGFDMGSLSGGGSLFAGDNILDILKSRNIIQNVLLSKVDSSKGAASETLADLFLDFSGWKRTWITKQQVKEIGFYNLKPGGFLSLQQDSILNLIHEFILTRSLATERLNKKGSIIKVVITAANPYFSKLMSDRIIDESKSFYITVKTNTSQQNVNRLERKSDSLLALLNNKSYEAAASFVLDGNPALRSLNVPSELKLRDKTILGTLYAEVVKNLELSRISLSQQTPIIQILDKPSYPLVDKKKGKFLLVSVFALGSLLFLILILGLKSVFTSISRK